MKGHRSYGGVWGGQYATYHHNLVANQNSRAVRFNGGRAHDTVALIDYRNNVIYNWGNLNAAYGGEVNIPGGRSEVNLVNNYYKPGPITPKDKPIAYRILKPEAGRDSANKSNFGKAYVNGNIVEGFDKVSADNWAGGVQIGDNNGGAGSYEAAIRVDKPMPMASITMLSAKEAYDYVLNNAGANLPKRDAVDERILKTVKTGKISYTEGGRTGIGKQFIKRRLPEDSYKQGIITHPSQVGGYPEYKGTPYKDGDNDGLPDEYEVKIGLNAKDASDAAKIGKNGYSNIEIYLNSVVNEKNVAPIAKK